MMVDITPPQERENFPNCTALQRARLCKEFLDFLARIQNDTEAYFQMALEEAAANNERDDEYYVTVIYRDGVTSSPDPELLLAFFPEKYKTWKDAEVAKFKPKMTKVAFESLWKTEGSTRQEKKESKERNAAEMAKCMREHPVKTQYRLSSIAELEAWKKAHPKEEDD